MIDTHSFISFKDWSAEQFKNPEFRRHYEALAPEFAVARAVMSARVSKSLTQKQLAKLLGTKQSAISRVESGRSNPSLQFLKKIAKACDATLQVSFTPR